MNDFAKALNLTKQAERISETADDALSSILVFDILGNICTFQGEFERAQIYYEKCLLLQIEIDHFRLNRTYFNLVMNCIKLGLIEQATSYLGKLEILVKEYQQKHHRYLKAAKQSLLLCRVRISTYHDPVSNFNDIQSLYLEVINDPEVEPIYLMHGYINYINILLSTFEMTQDHSIIKDLKSIISKMKKQATKYGLQTLRVKGEWLLYKVALSENEQQEADHIFNRILLLTSTINLDELNKRIIEDAESYKSGDDGLQLTNILMDDILYERYRIVITNT
ncbi:MAG: hypothetical protein ACXAB7_03525 [Candidatus Kariarchaeaceae archaeon]